MNKNLPLLTEQKYMLFSYQTSIYKEIVINISIINTVNLLTINKLISHLNLELF